MSYKINSRNTVTLTLSYAGGKPLVFAFKAQQVIYEKSSWWNVFSPAEANFHIKEAGEIVFKSPERFPAIALQSGNTLLDI